jgi:hypothetical protein
MLTALFFMGSSFSYAPGRATALYISDGEKHGGETSRFLERWIDVFQDMT